MDNVRCETRAEARKAFETIVKEMVSDGEGKWMGACWNVRDGRVTLAGYTTFRFPMADFLAAVSLLGLQLHKEVVKTDKESDPMPMRIVGKDSTPAAADVKSSCGDASEEK